MTPQGRRSLLRAEPALSRLLLRGRRAREGDNDRVPDLWVRESRGGSPSDLGYTLVKGLRTHLLLRLHGDLTDVPSGRNRTGLWYQDRRHVSALTTEWEGAPLAARFRKQVRGLGFLYRSFGEVERVDAVQAERGGAAIWFLARRPGALRLRMRLAHGAMWPENPVPATYQLKGRAGRWALESPQGSTGVGLWPPGAWETRLTDDLLELTARGVGEARVELSLDGSRWRRGDLERALAYHRRSLRGPRLETPSFRMNKLFLWAQHDLLELYSDSAVGRGFYAGLPCFSWFFGRDGEWMSLAASLVGLGALARDHLGTLARHAAGDRLPHEIPLVREPGSDPPRPRPIPSAYMSIDTNPLWALARIRLSRWTQEPLEEGALRRYLDFTRGLDRDGDGLIENNFQEKLIGWTESWADRRDGPCIDANAWWVAAATEFARATGEDRYSAPTLVRRLLSSFFRRTEGGLEILDSWKGSEERRIRTPAELVPAIYFDDPVLREAVEQLSQPDLLPPWGARALSTEDPAFDGGYHTGTVWPLMTGWYVLAAYRQGLPDRAFEMLKTFPLLAFGAPDPGRLSETYHTDYPEPTGQLFQGWSSSLFLQGVVEGLFGLDPDGSPGVGGLGRNARPRLPSGWREMGLRGLAYRGRRYDLKVRADRLEVRPTH